MLNAILWLPLAVAVVVALLPARFSAPVSFAGGLGTLGLAVALIADFDKGVPGLQHVVDESWIADLGVRYSLGVDGISLFLVPMNSPGITVTPMPTIGDEITNMVFLDDVYVPNDYMVGERGKGFHAQEFLRNFDCMGVQRHLKATGIFARLNHRDAKPGYLPDIPRTLGYVVEVSARHPQLHGLHGLLMDLRIPGITA